MGCLVKVNTSSSIILHTHSHAMLSHEWEREGPKIRGTNFWTNFFYIYNKKGNGQFQNEKIVI